jgi:hypothetical protein
MMPTQSQVKAYTTDHLVSAARHWDDTAGNWEAVFTRVRDQLGSIGWEGDAADAAIQASHMDAAKVATHADQLRAAAKMASRAADELRLAQRDILNSVGDITDQGFSVEEDWSVTDQSSGIRSYSDVTRLAQAQAFAAELGTKLAAFMAQESATAAQLSAAAATTATVQSTFPPKPQPHNDTQMLDNGNRIKLDPTTTTTPTTTSPTPEPGCGPIDLSKVIKSVAEWNAKEDDLAARIAAHNRLPRDFDDRDPRQAAAHARYNDEEQRLRDEQKQLEDERWQLTNEVTQCGGKLVDGQIQFPDGETIPAPGSRPPAVTHTPAPHYGEPLPSDAPPVTGTPRPNRLGPPVIGPWATTPPTTTRSR